LFGITFLNTAFLAGAIAAILPILIHLFSRQKTITVDFSTVRFLRLSHRKRIRRLQVRQILLLILRTLIVLFCALALARPTLKGAFGAGVIAQAKTSINIVLDHSFSMDALRQDGSLFSAAKRKALAITELLGEGDEAYLTLFADQPQPVFEQPTYNFDLLKDEIRAAPLSHRPTDVKPALVQAYEQLQASKNLNKELYLITDLQASGWDSLVASPLELELDDATRTYIIPILPEETENLAVQAVDYSNQLLRLGEPVVFRIQVANLGETDVSDRLVQLFIEGERRAQAGISVKAGRVNTVALSVTFEEEGTYSGYVELADDVLPVDNRYYFTITLQSSPRVLIVEDMPPAEADPFRNSAFYLSVALQPQRGSEVLAQPDRITVADLSRQSLSDYQTVVLANVTDLPITAVAQLENFVDQGGGLLVMLGDRIDPQFYNREFLPKFAPISIAAPIGDETRHQTYITVDQADVNHPILQVFADKKNGSLEQAQFYKAFTLLPGPNTFVLATFNNNVPLLVEGKKGKGAILVMGSNPDMVWSNLPVKGIFLPLMHRTVQYLASGTVGDHTDYRVGMPIRTQLPSIPLGQTVQVLDPQDQTTLIEPKIQQDHVLIEITHTDLAGIYQLRVGTRVIAKYAVNVDTRESDLTRRQPDQTADLLPQAILVPEQANLASAITKTRYGRELWKEFLWIVLGLMVAEMLIARDNKDRLDED